LSGRKAKEETSAEQPQEKAQTGKKASALSLDLSTAFSKLSKYLSRKLGRLAAAKVVTLDLDRAGIRLMESKGGVVTKWADLSFEPEESEQRMASESYLGAKVKQLMKSSGITANKVIASISGLYTISRMVPVSSLPPAPTLEESVDDVKKEIMPVSPDSIYFSWQTVNVNSKDERQLFAIGIPRYIMDQEIRSLKLAGINPYIVELRSMALARMVKREKAIVLNIEASSFDVVITVNGIPVIMHTKDWRPDEPNAEESIEQLALSVEMTVDFHNVHHLDVSLDASTPLFITGAMSSDFTLVENLRNRLAYSVEQLVPALKYPVFFPVCQYAANIGLALRKELSYQGDDIKNGFSPLEMNLLPDAYRPWRPTARQIYSAVVMVAALALLLPMFDATSEATNSTASLQHQYDILYNQLTLKQQEIQKREPLQRAVGQYESLVSRDRIFTDDIKVIRDSATQTGVTVKSIVHNGDSIAVSCEAKDYLGFRNYLNALEESGRFSGPIPPPEGYPYTKGGDIKLQPQTPPAGQ
jgi:hypothetical protein